MKHPKQLPEFTYNQFKKEVKSYLSKFSDHNSKLFSQEVCDFLNSNRENLPCYDSCSFIPASKHPISEEKMNSKCPLLKIDKGACEGIRTIVNHIAGMTDRYAHIEYSRLYFPPEISRL